MCVAIMTTNKNKILIAIVVLVLIAGTVYLITSKRAVAPVVVEDANTVTRKDACYLRETKGGLEDTPVVDYVFVSVNYDVGDEVHGIINFIPAEKDSLVGTYTGVVENNEGMKGYPFRLNTTYAGLGEGVISYQQEVIIVGENDVKMGSGERYLDASGVYKFKNTSNLVYNNSLPKVECSSVPEVLGADYSISK